MVRICASILTSADVTTECVSGLLNDRRRGRRSVISELGEADQGGMCAKAFSKVSGKASEVNKIRLLASAISPADAIPQ
jgi:hypothetical protein